MSALTRDRAEVSEVLSEELDLLMVDEFQDTSPIQLALFLKLATFAKAAALRSQGVPSATAQPGLLATPEATLAMACLRRLNDSTDTIATAEIISLGDCLESEVWLASRLRYRQAGGPENEWMEGETGGQASHLLISKLATIRRGLSLLTPAEAKRPAGSVDLGNDSLDGRACR